MHDKPWEEHTIDMLHMLHDMPQIATVIHAQPDAIRSPLVGFHCGSQSLKIHRAVAKAGTAAGRFRSPKGVVDEDEEPVTFAGIA